MEVYQAIKGNRSVRQFTAQPVPRDDIQQIVNAGRLSGSAKNKQPWEFVVVTSRETLQNLSACGPWCGHLAGAAFAVVMVTPGLNEPPTLTTPFDLGRASQNMILTAWEKGIGSCMATIYEPDKARAALGVPANMQIPWAISFGYPHPESDPRNRPAKSTGRRPVDEVIHWESWE